MEYNPTKNKLQSNIWKFAIHTITARRAYWPLLAVFFLTFPDNTLKQIGFFLAIGQVAGFILEVPSGYIADKIGHKKALIISKISLLLSTALFAIGGNFYIFALGSIFVSTGFAFDSGTLTAFMHEVLKALKQDHLYSKIIGKIRSKTFIVSAIILALLPLTVSINFRLPFIIAFFIDLTGLIVTLSFVVPKNKKVEIEELKEDNFIAVLKAGKKLRFYPILTLTSFISAMVIGASIYRDVYQQFLGISVIHLGFFFAMSRVVAAVVSNYFYRLHNVVSARTYLAIAVLFYSLFIIGIGFASNKWFVAIGFVIMVGSLHGSATLLDHYKLEYIQKSKFKATLLSIGGLGRSLFGVFTNLTLAFLIGRYLYSLGYVYYGLIGLVVLLSIYSVFIIWGLPKKHS